MALNHNTPVAVLTRLAGDPDVRVRWGVALNRNIPTAVLARLAEDPSPEVREATANRLMAT